MFKKLSEKKLVVVKKLRYQFYYENKRDISNKFKIKAPWLVLLRPGHAPTHYGERVMMKELLNNEKVLPSHLQIQTTIDNVWFRSYMVS